jgi:RES domain
MKTAGCARLSLRPQTGTWFRALNLRHWKTRLHTDHSRTSRSRFSNASATSPLYRILYLGENHQVAIYEVGALLGNPNAPLSSPKGTWVQMSLQVTLYHVADLCDATQQKLITTNDQEFTGAWANSSVPAPTQQLGAALHAIPLLEGFVFPSSKVGSRNLAIFPDKLDARSSIIFQNDLDLKTERFL